MVSNPCEDFLVSTRSCCSQNYFFYLQYFKLSDAGCSFVDTGYCKADCGVSSGKNCENVSVVICNVVALGLTGPHRENAEANN